MRKLITGRFEKVYSPETDIPIGLILGASTLAACAMLLPLLVH